MLGEIDPLCTYLKQNINSLEKVKYEISSKQYDAGVFDKQGKRIEVEITTSDPAKKKRELDFGKESMLDYLQLLAIIHQKSYLNAQRVGFVAVKMNLKEQMKLHMIIFILKIFF